MFASVGFCMGIRQKQGGIRFIYTNTKRDLMKGGKLMSSLKKAQFSTTPGVRDTAASPAQPYAFIS
jgi:hypothetical protein